MSSVAGDAISVTAFGAVCDGNTDDTAAIQRALDSVAQRHGGLLLFPARTCRIAGTVRQSALHDVALVGYGTTLAGGENGPILEIGKLAGTAGPGAVSNVSIIGFRVTNGGWGAASPHNKSSADAIALYNCQLCAVDITAEHVYGAALRFGGDTTAADAIGEWSQLRVRAFDVGYGLYLFRTSTNTAEVVVRRAHRCGVVVQDAAQLLLNVTSDETLSAPDPTEYDGVGLLLRDVNWSTINGTVGLAAREALRLSGNTQWNTIRGAFYDSSTAKDAATSNVVIGQPEGTTQPKHNQFEIYAGYSGTGGKNRPRNGLLDFSGDHNRVVGIDADGVIGEAVALPRNATLENRGK